MVAIRVRVNNTNSRPPVFEQASYAAQVPEGVAIGYRVIAVEVSCKLLWIALLYFTALVFRLLGRKSTSKPHGVDFNDLN